MENEKKIKLLQMMYAGVLADSVLRMGREGILGKVTEEKKREQMATGKARAVQLGITKPEDVFLALSEIFGCANWEINHNESGFTAEASACMLCGMAKKLGAESPCRVYCLDPMEGVVSGLSPNAEYNSKETLFEGTKCRVEVKIPK